MSDDLLEIVDNIKQPSVWIRVLFMVIFGVASYLLLLPLIIILSIAQALFTLITGETNANLRYFSATLELYVSQIIKFLTFLSEEKPFPFSDFPELEDDSLEEGAKPAGAAKKANGAAVDTEKPKDSSLSKSSSRKAPAKKASKKSPAKKKAAKKKAAKKTGNEAEAAKKPAEKDGNES